MPVGYKVKSTIWKSSVKWWSRPKCSRWCIQITNCDTKTSFPVVADEAFPLYYSLMIPYPHRELQYRYKIFNYWLSRAWQVIECSFRFFDQKKNALFQKAVEVPTEKAELFTRTACDLHNFIITGRRNGNCTLLSERSTEPRTEDCSHVTHNVALKPTVVLLM